MGSERDARLRKDVVGASLILAPVFSVVSWVLVPTSMVQGEAFVSDIAATDTGRAAISQVAGTLFFPLAIIAILGLTHLLKGCEGLVGTTGAGLAIVGLTLNTVAMGAVGTLAEAVYSGVDPQVAAALVEDTTGGLTGLLALSGVVLAAVGTTMLGIALYRARTVPRASAVLLMVYGPLQAVAFGIEDIALITVSYAVMASAFAPIGWSIARSTVDGWRRPPTLVGSHEGGPDRGANEVDAAAPTR